MSFKQQSFEDAKAAFKPLKRRSLASRGSVAAREGKTPNAASGTGIVHRASIARKPATGKRKAKPKKRHKMPSRKSLVRKADNLVSQIIRLRDGKCVECGSTENLSNGHVLGRRSFATRFDITPDGDCHCQCWSHNYRAAMSSAVDYHAWYVRTFGAEAFDALYRRWSAGKKWSRLELIALCVELQVKLTAMQENP